jgi:acyl-CoA reductase-like NAD-dependent aldehyde dehydrogenase
MSEIRVLDKASHECVATLPVDEPESIKDIAERARAAQPAWDAMGAKARIKLIKRARKHFVRDRKKIIDALAAETGKTAFDVVGEVFSVCQDIGHYCGKSAKWLKTEKRGTWPLFGKKGLVHYKPFGLVGVISPWNAPLNLAMSDVLPALFAGNSVIVKPSEVTPLAVKYTCEALNRVLPEGVLNCVIGEGPTGAAMVDLVDMIAVTGSTRTGQRVMERASARLTPVLLELGGKDPMIVLEDADLERASNAAVWGACFMTGQVCIAREEGADVEMGGYRIQEGEGGVFFEPTLITNVNHDMRIMHEETFGPVACIMEVDGEDEAVALANDSEYGLNASVWTSDIERGIQIARRLESGNVCVNDLITSAGIHSLPFGGAKKSGVGTRHGGPDGLRIFCQKQSLMIEKRERPKEINWFPDHKVAKKLERLMTLMYR